MIIRDIFNTNKFFIYKYSRVIRPFLTALVAVLLGASVFGNLVVAQGNQQGGALEEVVVTARKVTEKLQDTPIAITVFSEADMEKMSLNDISDVGNFSPNVTFQAGEGQFGNSSSAFVFIRGVGQTDSALFADPGVGIFIDGVFLGRSHGGVLELVDLERIEVLRGPQGTLFGRNTIGGAISLISKKPDEEYHGSVQLTTGRYDRLDAKLHVNLPVTDNLFVSVGASSNNRDGYTRSSFNGTDYGDIDRDTFRGTMRWLPSESVEVLVAGDYHRKRENGPLQKMYRWNVTPLSAFYNDAARKGGGFTFSDEWLSDDIYENFTNEPTPTDDLDLWGVSATINWAINDSIDLTSITAYREVHNVTVLDADSSPAVWLDPEQKINQEQFSQELRLSGTSMGDRLTWLVGAYYYSEDGESNTLVNLWTDLFTNLENAPLNSVDVLLLPIPPGICPVPSPPFPPGPAGPAICAGGAGNPWNAFWTGAVGGFPDTTWNQNNTDNESYAGFLNASYAFTEKLSLSAGIRYSYDKKQLVQVDIDTTTGAVVPSPLDRNESGNWSSWDPKVSIEYKITPDALLYVSASRGFKSGGFNGRSQNRPVFDEYDPETLWSYEAGFKTDWFENRLRVNAAVFFNQYDDIQFTASDVDASGNAVFQLTNAGNADVKGVELEFQALAGQHLEFTGGVGYLDTDYTFVKATPGSQIGLDNAFPKAPEWNVNLSSEYRTPLADIGSFAARLDYVYVSRIEQDLFNTPALSTPGNSKLNARLAFTDDLEKWELAVFVTNLTNKKTLATGFTVAALGYDLIVPARKREWGLSLKYNF